MRMPPTLSAPAKVILLGEHAVVYGTPAIALPVSGLRAKAAIHRSGLPLAVSLADLGLRVSLADRAHDERAAAVQALMRSVVDHLGLECPHGEITLQSDIPIAGGLGSSAAIAAAIARGIAALHERIIPAAALSQIVYESERIHHGQPSGIDNSVVVYEQPIYFVRQRPPRMLTAKGSLRFLIADSGQPASTGKAVASVRRLKQEQPEMTRGIFARIQGIVDAGRACLENGDQARLGQLMSDNQRQLVRLGVSSARLDELCLAAERAGALGAKLSGSGRGGNMIALVDRDRAEAVKRALTAAGATTVRELSLP